MRILVLCEGDAETFDSWSGTSRKVVEALRAHGHEVRCGDVDLYGGSRIVAAGASFSPDRRRWWVRYHVGRVGYELRSSRARRLVQQNRDWADVVLQFGATFGGATDGTSLPYTLYCDSNIALSEKGSASGFGEAAKLTPAELERVWQREANVYRHASVIFTFSDFLRRSFEEDFGVAPERVRTVWGGSNLEGSDAATASGARPPRVLFVGRAFERKGGDVLLKAFGQAREAIPEAELVIVGPSGLEVNEPGVRVAGFIDKDTEEGSRQLNELYATARVFALPTRFEPFGVSYVEAMSYGLPCIGTRVWAVPEIVVDGETGYIVDVDHVDALADRLKRLLGDAQLAARMGAAGRQRVRQHFTWSAVAGKMSDQLAHLCSAAAAVS